jgi:demethylmenaquinone methyltransferase/2-methoxy-6-polyprenyl-1,4-benzoquinol methylase
MDHFGLLAPYYDRVIKPGDKNWLFEILGLPAPGFLLDAGGGTGRITKLLQDQVDQVVIADLSFEMLSQAHSKNGLNPTCSHTEKLPFRNKIFDRVIMVDALHHVCDHHETAEELWRVLKPGGRIVIEEPDIRMFGVKILAVAEKIMGMRSHFIAPPTIASLFERNAPIKVIQKGNFSWVIIEKLNE